ncbi:MAG: apolipoprotein N-acyltransferase [Nakamurella sp.]
MASPTVDSDPAVPPDVPAGTVRRSRAAARAAGSAAEGTGRLTSWRRSLVGSGGLRILSAVAGGLAVYAAFAPSTWWWSAIIGFALFGLALDGRSWQAGTGLGFIFGLAFFLPLLSFTNIYVGDFPWYALSVMEALLTAPAGALIAIASRRLPLWPLWAAAGWITGEAIRARLPFGGFPWGAVAFSQPDGPLLPVASLLGAPALGFLTALAGFALAQVAAALLISRTRWRSAVVFGGIAMLLAPFLLGLAGRSTVQDGDGAPTETIAVIQGDVPRPGLEFNAERRAVLDLHAKQTHQLAADVRAGKAPQPTLVIWPENSTDIDPYRNADANAVISAAASDIGVPILVGAVVQTDNPAEDYNMGIVWDPVTGPGATYTKRHPLPFGEYIPYRSFFRIFSDKVDLVRGTFLPGGTPGNLEVAGVNLGDVICFEVVYDDLVRDVVQGGAQVLVVQTNNATFGYTNETYQQQAMSRVRAVEHGREVLISSTSGVSTVIGPDGTVQSTIPLFTPGYLTPNVPLITATTPGTVLGGPLEWVLAVAAPLALAVVVLRSGRRKHALAEPTEDLTT